MVEEWKGDKMRTTNKTRKARSTIIIGMFLLHTIAAAGWAGELVFWGRDLYGAFSNTPAGNDFKAVSASTTHCIALKSDGSLVSWGLDNYGQVSNTPKGTGFKAIAAGGGHSVAVKSDGSLIAWGRDDYGQVSDTPAGTGFKAVAAGDAHCVALKTDGSLVAWGYDYYWQVFFTPTGNDFLAVAAGTYHNVALKTDGSLVAWGYSGYLQTRCPAGNDFTAVGAGNFHSVAVESGGLTGWGDDSYFSNIPPGSGIVAVAAGTGHTLALKSDGSLTAYGNDYDGSVNDTPAGNGFTAIAAGGFYNVAIRDTQITPIPAVSIAATDASAGEPANDGHFTVSRTGDTSSSLLVYYSTSGSTASSGYDYAALPGYVYIPAGQSSAVVSVAVIDDSTVESSETVRLTISSNAAYTIGSPSYATVSIADDDIAVVKPTVTVTATDASAGEPANDGSLTISRTGDTSGNLLVYYSTSGSTASAGTDYAALPNYVYILAGQSSASIPVDVIDDTTVESSETVRLTISSNAAYSIGSPSSATVTIADDDTQPPAENKSVVAINAADSSAGEPSNHGYCILSRTGDTSSSLRVYYSTSGSTASAGTDYAALSGYVDFSSGQAYAVIYVVVYDDYTTENSETVNLTISSNAAYTIGSPSSATVTIADNDGTPVEKPVVTISATDASAAEPSNDGAFTISRTGATSSSLLVYYSTSGSTASSGADYKALPGYVYILSGQTSAVISVDVYDDSTVESSETVRLTLSSNTAYTIGSPSYATVTIADDDSAPVEKPVVTIAAPDAYAGEPANDGYFRISRTGDTSSNLLVYYSTSGTATAGTDYAALSNYVYILAGQSSVDIPVVVYNDSAVESSETVLLTISSNAAYTIGNPSSATVTITDDDDAPPPPADAEELMAKTLAFFYESKGKTLVEVGLFDLYRMQYRLETAYDRIVEENYNEACVQLWEALSRCDGENDIPDYVTGEATEELAQYIWDVIDAIGCK
jgi:hypothetical protein